MQDNQTMLRDYAIIRGIFIQISPLIQKRIEYRQLILRLTFSLLKITF